MKFISEKQNDLIFLCGAATLVLILGLGRGSLASWDEANYAVVSKLVAQNNDWITFRWPGGGFFFDKPPLYFWLTALFYQLFGIGEFATRLPSALGGIGLVAVTYFLGRRLYGRSTGVACAGVLLGTTEFLRYARFGTMDVLQLFFFTALILTYLGKPTAGSTDDGGGELGASPCWGWFWLAGAGCFMTKGPLVFLAWGIVGFHLLTARRFRTLTAPGFWRGLALFAALVIPWHVAAYVAQPEGFWREYVVKNYVTRGAQALDGHEGNVFFYLRVLVNKYQPWIFLAPGAIALSLWRLVRGARDRSREALLLVWAAGILVFFTFRVQTKLNWYILPMLPALSVLTGAFLARIFGGKSAWIWIAVSAGLAAHLVSGSVFRADHSAGIRQLATVIHSRVPAQSTVYLYAHHEQPAALFYWERPVAYADSLAELDTILRRHQSVPGKGRATWLAVPAKAFESNVRQFTERGFHAIVRANTPNPDNNLYLLETRP